MSAPAWTGGKVALKGAWLAVIAAVVVAALAFGAVQTVRIEGFKLWPFEVTGWKPLAIERQTTIDSMFTAQQLAEAKAEAARIAKEAVYRDIAKRIDDNAKESLDAALAAADRFIAAGGVRPPADRSSPCRAGTAAGDYRAADPDRTGRAAQLDAPGSGAGNAGPTDRGPAAGFALVSAEDIRICTRNTVKAEAGRALALQLEAASRPAED